MSAPVRDSQHRSRDIPGAILGFLVWVFLVLAFWPGMAVLTRPFGPEKLCLLAHRFSPEALFDDEEVDRVREGFIVRRVLAETGRTFEAGSLTLRLPRGVDERPWIGALSSATLFLRTHLASFAWVGAVELRPLSGAEGRYDGLTLAVDPDGPEPIRSMIHELAHCWLLWSLLPSLPVDCPRWFNEGLVEEVAARLSGESPIDDAAQLVTRSMTVPPDALSAGFARSGRRVELQARRLFQRFLATHGWDGVRRVVEGLRRSRPFCSVLPLAFGERFEPWMKAGYEEFMSRDVLENLPRPLARIRLRRLIEVRPTAEVKSLVAAAIRQWPEDHRFMRLFDTVVIREIQRSIVNRHPEEARGQMRELRLATSREQALRLFASGTASLPAPDLLSPEPRGGLSAGCAALLGGSFLWLLYRALRQRVLPVVAGWWGMSGSPGSAIRWSTVGVLMVFGCWFIRFLIVAMVPYGGLTDWPDATRVQLAEHLSTVLLVLLWHSLAHITVDRDPQPANQCGHPALLDQPILPLALVVVAWVTPLALLATGLGSTQHATLQDPLPHLLAAFTNIAKITAGGLLVWGLAWRWAKRSGSGPWGPALAFACFRSGMWPDWTTLPWLFLQGRILGGMACRGVSPGRIILIDLLASIPAMAIVTGWSPPYDPLAARFLQGSMNTGEYLVAVVLLLLLALLSRLNEPRPS